MATGSRRSAVYEAELQDHLNALISKHGIRADQRYNLSGMMFVEEDPPRIEIPTLEVCPVAPSVNIAYMVGLHEIGHVVHGHTQGRPPHRDKTWYFDNGVLRSESEAWQFALDECRTSLDVKDCRFMVNRYLGSYIDTARRQAGRPYRLGNGNRHWIEFTFDDPNQEIVRQTQERLRTAWRHSTPKFDNTSNKEK